MTALWIILAIALVLTVLNLLPVGVDAAYADETFSLAARIGPFRLRLLPKPPDAKPKKKKPPKPKKEKPKKKSAPPDIRTILALAKLGLQALNRFRQRLRVQLLRLVFVSGAPDPYDTALAFGYVNAALGALTPLRSVPCASTSGTFRPAWIFRPGSRASTRASSARSASGRSLSSRWRSALDS